MLPVVILILLLFTITYCRKTALSICNGAWLHARRMRLLLCPDCVNQKRGGGAEKEDN